MTGDSQSLHKPLVFPGMLQLLQQPSSLLDMLKMVDLGEDMFPVDSRKSVMAFRKSRAAWGWRDLPAHAAPARVFGKLDAQLLSVIVWEKAATPCRSLEKE